MIGWLLLAIGAFAMENIKTIDAGCTDVNNDIECCFGTDVDLYVFDIKLHGCADLSINWDTLDVDLELTLNDTVLFDTTFGLDRPPELCTDIWGLHVCLGLTDLMLDDWTFSGCLSVIINDSKTIDLGCFSTSKDSKDSKENG